MATMETDLWFVAAVFALIPAAGVLRRGITVRRMLLATAIFAFLFGIVAMMLRTSESLRR
jgi:hypothetical protein